MQEQTVLKATAHYTRKKIEHKNAVGLSENEYEKLPVISKIALIINKTLCYRALKLILKKKIYPENI